MAGLLDAAKTAGMQFTDYNGQQVRTDDAYKQQLAATAAKTGQDAMERDKFLNPTTYGARWGVPATAQGAQTSTQTTGAGTTSGATQNAGSGGLLNSSITAPPAPQAVGYTPSTATAATSSASGYTSSAADAVKALAQGYTSQPTTVAPESTVQHQYDQLRRSDSPLIQQGTTTGTQAGNRRGLLNSSITVGAVEDAIMKNLLPIAQQDAQTHAQAGAATAAAENVSRQFGANAGNSASNLNAQLGTNTNLSNAQASDKAAAELAGAQNSASQLNAQLQTNVSMENSRAGTTASQFEAQAKNAAQTLAIENQMKTQLANLQANVTLTTSQKEIEARRIMADAQNRTSILNNASDNAARLEAAKMDNAIKSLDQEIRVDLAKISSENDQILRTNASAAEMYKQYSGNLASISASSSMDAAAKTAAQQTQLNALRAGLDAIGEVSKLDLGKYFEQDSIVAPTPEPTPEPTGRVSTFGETSDGGGE